MVYAHPIICLLVVVVLFWYRSEINLVFVSAAAQRLYRLLRCLMAAVSCLGRMSSGVVGPRVARRWSVFDTIYTYIMFIQRLNNVFVGVIQLFTGSLICDNFCLTRISQDSWILV